MKAYEDPVVLARVAAILNASRPPVRSEGPTDREPYRAPVTCGDRTPGAEAERAA